MRAPIEVDMCYRHPEIDDFLAMPREREDLRGLEFAGDGEGLLIRRYEVGELADASERQLPQRRTVEDGVSPAGTTEPVANAHRIQGVVDHWKAPKGVPAVPSVHFDGVPLRVGIAKRIRLLRRRESSAPKRDVPTVAVIAWDVGHNPLGRAHLLAEALERRYNVALIGFQFPRYGDAVWKPLRDARVQPKVTPGCDFPAFQQTLSAMVSRIDADAVIACKARLPAVQLGLMLKAVRNRPLLVDVDDYELAFFENRQPLANLAEVPPQTLVTPHDESWTRYAERLLPYADELLVSNPALARRYGGVVVPHARDETRFDPARVDAAAARRRLRLRRSHRVVLFVGTPRPHKGVMQVLQAVKACGSRDFRLVVVGTPPDEWFAADLKRAGGDVLKMVPDQPFERLPELLAVADLVCLLQDTQSEISRYQLPAKVVDAAAMGIPVLASRTEPLEPLIEAGVVEPVTADTLAGRVDYWLRAAAEERRRQAVVSRRWFLEHASYAAVLPTLASLIDGHLAGPRFLDIGARTFLEAQALRFPRRLP